MSRAVASWSKAFRLGLALRNARWFDYNGWGDHRDNHTISPFWLDDRPPLLRHVGVRPAAGWADYWKSQAKKFCDFCKCWIADNKPSIEFHEKGKRHKENVAKRLSEISKKSRQEHQKSLKVDDEMKKMEEAAMKAYMKDMEENADLTSQLLKETLSEKSQKCDSDTPSSSIKTEPSTEEAAPEVPAPEVPKLWYEAKSEQGYIYFWHIETGGKSLPSKETLRGHSDSSFRGEGYIQCCVGVRLCDMYSNQELAEIHFMYGKADGNAALARRLYQERCPQRQCPDRKTFVRLHYQSRWEPPEEGFMSLDEQSKEEKKKLKKEAEKERQRKEEEAKRKEETRAYIEREKMKSRRLKEEDTKPEEESLPVLGPAPRVDPYGSWKTIETRLPEPVDLQLPEQEYVPIKVPSVAEPQVKFKEKTLSGLGEDAGGAGASFKKRKLNNNPKRNMRQRLNEDY
ncbi:hypothetical protein ANN_22412 [Periplaneta americana]|uniref:Matrin-type domain-containing protein n=1 Tax=Periplaneta americana TaxID=6978 RepID=A0ABQ8S8D8_PERAM|nr:hypothetical protein ANN_22412 [Periplaneta americana]